MKQLMLAALLAAPLLAAAQPTPPLPPAAAAADSETAKFVRLTRALEAEPDRADADDFRKWLATWAIETPDYTVNVCPGVLAPALTSDSKTPHAGELMMQLMYGNAMFQIEHGTNTDELSRQVAAVESALRVYAAYVAKDPAANDPHLDTLVAKRDAGTLRAHLAPMMEKECAPGDKAAKDDAAEKPSTPFLGGFIRESHVVYPLKVAGWEMRDEQRYESQEWGASVRFSREGDTRAWIDVFFYPVGAVPEADIARLANSEREALLVSHGASMPDPKDITALSTFAVADVTAYALDFAYVHEKQARNSAMVFAVDAMYAIKFRYSADASKTSRATVRTEVEAFARALLPQVEIQSTGVCGSMEPRQAYPGCAGAEPMQPIVPEGKRELRFEYRAGEPASVARPLRAKRAGTG